MTLTATVAFRHPTIESLATVIVEGEPEIDDTATTTSTGRATRDDGRHRDRRPGHPVPRRHEHPRRDVAGAARGPRRDHRPARGALDGVPRGAAHRRAGRQGPHPRRIPLRHQGFRRRVLRAVEDGGRQHRPAAADGAGADVGSVGERPHPGVGAARCRASASTSAAPPTTTASWRCPTRRSPTRTPSPARRVRSSPTGCPTSTTSAARRSPSTPRARARWSPCTRACRRCVQARPTSCSPVASTR